MLIISIFYTHENIIIFKCFLKTTNKNDVY